MALFTGTQQSYYQGADNNFNTSDDLNTYGNYQFVNIKDLITNFIITYVGEGKIISKVKRPDVAFHAQRALQELSYDTLKSIKTQEVEVGPNLNLPLPHDYVNYVKICYVDDNGIENILYKSRKTSNPRALSQDSSFNYQFDSDGNLTEASDSNSWLRYKESSNVDSGDTNNEDEPGALLNEGGRYGLEPEFAQSNGIFYIDDSRGRIHFSSNMLEKTILIKYISDSLATEGEMQVHKFAEEAVYKFIAHAILASRANTPEYLVARFKKEKFAEIRKAKIRLSNIKSEELVQVMRGKSKRIKH